MQKKAVSSKAVIWRKSNDKRGHFGLFYFYSFTKCATVGILIENTLLEETALNEEQNSVDQLIEEIYACIDTPDPWPVRRRKPTRVPLRRRILSIAGKTGLILAETVLLLAIALYGLMFILAKGPSPSARNLFIRSVRETSAMGWLANLYFSEEEIAQITGSGSVPEYVEMDTSLIEIPKPSEGDGDNSGPKPDAWGFVDEDGDGIILQEVKGTGYRGYMMIVLDPSRVILGSVPEAYGSHGYKLAAMVDHFDAVAGTNAGGFYDEGGGGNGSVPDTLIVYEGKIYYPELGCGSGFAGFDRNHILHVGKFDVDDIKERDIQYGVGFGPILVLNGEVAYTGHLGSGVNPRTAIGQRSDGAVLMLVVEGRQVASLGATYLDLAQIFLNYGAVNACNMDGGSSSMMWYQGDYVNNCASVIGIRPIPTAFLVMKKGADGNG